LVFSPTAELLAAGFAFTGGTIGLWDPASGAPRGQLSNHTGWIHALAFTPDGQVRTWDLFARRELAALRGHWTQVWSAACSSDGLRLATGGVGPKDAVKLWDLATQRELLTLPAEGQHFMQISLSPDGNTLVATSLHGAAHLWRAPSWAEIAAVEKGQVAP